MKSFIRTFIITMIIFTAIFTPALAWWNDIQDNTIFSGDTILSEEMPVMIDENSPFFEKFTKSNRLNVLLMGINDDLADTIILFSYNMDNDKIDMISIPRDTYYPRKGYNEASEKKINCSYRDGKEIGLASAVSDLLEGIPINFYMKVDYDGVANIVDSMGGIPMDVPFHMHYTDVWDDPPLYIDIPEGYQILDGEKAIQFIRFRKGDKGYKGYSEGDIGRIKTQQEFIKSAFKQALGLNIVKVINTVLDNVESDVKVKTVLSVVKRATELSSNKFISHTVPGEAKYGDGDLSFWYADKNGIKEMLNDIYSDKEDIDEDMYTEDEEDEKM